MNRVLTTAPARRHRPRGLPAPKSSPLPGWLQGIVLLLFISNCFQHPYDQVGNKLTVVDGKSHTTSFTYDGLNRLLTTTDAVGKVTTLSYNALNKTERVDALGQATYYFYDLRNRLGSVFYQSTAAANSLRTYQYDAVGNLLSVTEPAKSGAADVASTYDVLNRAITETSGGKQHTYTLDLAGNRLSTVYGGTGRTITSTYDALNRLASMTENGRTTTYGYDLNGNIALKTAPNGDTETTTFDALNRAGSEAAATSASAALFSYSYEEKRGQAPFSKLNWRKKKGTGTINDSK